MSGMLRKWWEALSQRERRLIGVMIALLGIVFIWLVVSQLSAALEDTRRAYDEAVLEHAAVAEKVDALKALQQRKAAPLAGTISEIVSQSASDLGLVLANNEADGAERATIAISTVRPTAFFGWISELQDRGIVVERLVARANSDKTISIEAALRGAAQ